MPRGVVTAQFIESTHAAYSARFSEEFGKSIHFVFTDEPETGTSEKGFHLSHSFLDEFLTEHGYPLDSRLACGSCPDSPGVRHDYFVTPQPAFHLQLCQAVPRLVRRPRARIHGTFPGKRVAFPKGCPR